MVESAVDSREVVEVLTAVEVQLRAFCEVSAVVVCLHVGRAGPEAECIFVLEMRIKPPVETEPRPRKSQRCNHRHHVYHPPTPIRRSSRNKRDLHRRKPTRRHSGRLVQPWNTATLFPGRLVATRVLRPLQTLRSENTRRLRRVREGLPTAHVPWFVIPRPLKSRLRGLAELLRVAHGCLLILLAPWRWGWRWRSY